MAIKSHSPALRGTSVDWGLPAATRLRRMLDEYQTRNFSNETRFAAYLGVSQRAFAYCMSGGRAFGASILGAIVTRVPGSESLVLDYLKEAASRPAARR